MNNYYKAIIFGLSIVVFILLFNVFSYKKLNSSKDNSIKDIGQLDSLKIANYPFIKFVEAVNYKQEGNEVEANKIFKELLLSKNPTILSVVNFELENKVKSKIVYVEEEKKVIDNEESKIKSTIPQDEKKSNYLDLLKGLEVSQSTVDNLKSSKNFLELQSSKGKKIEYLGDILGGQANGFGIGLYESGSIYKGYWVNSLRHGSGKFAWKDGEKYEGDYQADLRHGTGIYYWKNGERYEGEWKEDKRHGIGTVYRKNGKVKKIGRWENDKLVEKSN